MIDGAQNCTFSIFQATDEEFSLIFPGPGQDMEYAEDLEARQIVRRFFRALSAVWERPIRKQEALGIHGTLLYQLERYKQWYPEKREDAVTSSAINSAQRKLFGSSPY